MLDDLKGLSWGEAGVLLLGVFGIAFLLLGALYVAVVMVI